MNWLILFGWKMRDQLDMESNERLWEKNPEE